MRIDLTRTFSTTRDSDDESVDWDGFFGGGSGEYSWTDLHERPVVVVLGEAGIGKTVEFQNEVDRLRRQGKFAFFAPLNQVLDNGSWQLTVQGNDANYQHWEKSSETGYFFLDAVDEARLINHSALERALAVIRVGMRNYSARVRVAVSSRITDWAVQSVRESVRKNLVVPIAAASNVTDVVEVGFDIAESGTLSHDVSAQPLDAFVVSMDPLSVPESKKLADALGVQDAAGFWSAIDDGDYKFMAARPLDLEWMVKLWNERHSLGTYSQLMENNVSNRLTEVNPNYQNEGAALSLDQLRDGAEELAAATEFSGRPFVSTTRDIDANEVDTAAVLSDWKAIEVARLLASAIFDEATFSRVKFHHRSVREYLAASWVNRQLIHGVPLHRVLPLFCASPFGAPVLIPSRRAALCWLAALNVEVREWLTREFPAMLVFDGDPEAWDILSADEAFTSYVERVRDGLRTDWWNNASELRRVARRLSPGRVAALLSHAATNSNAIRVLLPFVRYGKLFDCADAVFEIYRSPNTSPEERQHALITLATVGSVEQRTLIKEDLLSKHLQSNELISAALAVVNWTQLKVEELVNVFEAAGVESGYGNGPMAQVIKETLLPNADAASAELLLSAVLAALPVPKKGEGLVCFPESEQPERAWLFNVLSDCLERLLVLLPTSRVTYPQVCIDAAELLQSIRDSGFSNRGELNRLHALIAERPALRWRLAEEIAQSEKIGHSTSRLTWGGDSCLVSFGKGDILDLVAKATDVNASKEVRDIWFEVGMNVALRELRGHQRTAALKALASGPEEPPRVERISSAVSQWLSGAKQRRHWKREDRKRKLEMRLAHERDRENLGRDIERIRDGSHGGTLRWLINYSYNCSERKSLTQVDFDVIARDFGQPIAEALASGLIIAWSKVDTPNPGDYLDGKIPWQVLIGLAGLHALLSRGNGIASLDAADAKRAAQLAVWELNGPPSWFEELATTNEKAVSEALHPWIIAEAMPSSDSRRIRGALELALKCPSPIRLKLLQPLVQPVKDGQIGTKETLRAVLKALREDALLEPAEVASICRTKVLASINTEGLVSELGWLHMWMEVDRDNAWHWLQAYVAGNRTLAAKQVQDLAEAILSDGWVQSTHSAPDIPLLMKMHSLLAEHSYVPDAQTATEEDGVLNPPVIRLRDSIPNILAQIRGAAANQALVDIATAEAATERKQWLDSRLQQHAALEAERFALVEPLNLKTFGAPFLSEPRSERQLFEQVVGRLEEVRKSVEEGPFSERVLFSVGMPEKHLQLWLAARFLDTQNRRFSVHREEEVDANNRTDVQLSCQYGNVCVEIKPVDRERSYSATSLVDTLRTQIVGQYLKGLNSAHGIMVLFRLDNKTWDIPGSAKAQHFDQLVQYLNTQAEVIKRESPGVQELRVLGLNCLL